MSCDQMMVPSGAVVVVVVVIVVVMDEKEELMRDRGLSAGCRTIGFGLCLDE